MSEFKLNIGDPKSKKTLKKEVKDAEATVFIGKKIGDKIKGESFGYEGYEFELRGGSDNAGFPMRKDVQGSHRKKILIVSGIGIRKNRAGRKVRRTVAGNTVHEDNTAQINLKVLKAGKAALFEEAKPEEEPKKDAPKEEKKKEPKKEESSKKEE